ncbi:hypothetical protein LCGC14_2859450 [marine sediment metagenome]|uniref:Uncharacterized protein n=1 Tax=marine sediment metagenome TaxID=412755 RepID=A0A0F8Y633_9ZZZZ
MTMNKQELARFRNQFPFRVTLGEQVLDMLTLEEIIGPYSLWRALNRLFLLDTDGNYYGAY